MPATTGQERRRSGESQQLLIHTYIFKAPHVGLLRAKQRKERGYGTVLLRRNLHGMYGYDTGRKLVSGHRSGKQVSGRTNTLHSQGRNPQRGQPAASESERHLILCHAMNDGGHTCSGFTVSVLPYNLVKVGLTLVRIFLNLSNRHCLCV